MINKMSSGWVEKLELIKRSKKIVLEEIIDIMAVKIILKKSLLDFKLLKFFVEK